MKPETKELIIEKADQSYLKWIVQCQVNMALET